MPPPAPPMCLAGKPSMPKFTKKKGYGIMIHTGKLHFYMKSSLFDFNSNLISDFNDLKETPCLVWKLGGGKGGLDESVEDRN